MRTFHETIATESQFKSRALMSSFVVAASTAISCFGVSVLIILKMIGFYINVAHLILHTRRT